MYKLIDYKSHEGTCYFKKNIQKEFVPSGWSIRYLELVIRSLELTIRYLELTIRSLEFVIRYLELVIRYS